MAYTKKMVEAVLKTRCSLVPLGDPFSKSSALQWRISFLIGERTLMWSLTRPQFYCFILMKKMIKYALANNEEEKNIVSSFVVKTVLFWELEQNDTCRWDDRSLISNVQTCFKNLANCIDKQCLPHYFVRTNNLFHNKLMDGNVRSNLKEEILSLANNILQHLHQECQIQCTTSNCTICSFPETVKTNHKDFPWLKDRLQNRFYLYFNLENTMHPCTLADLNNIDSDLKQLDADRCIFKHHIALVRQMLATHLGLIHHRDYLQDYLLHTIKEGQMLLKVTEERFKQGIESDAMCGILQLATFYLKQKLSKRVLQLVQVLYKCKVYQYDGSCSDLRLIRMSPDVILVDDMIFYEEAEIAHDVSFFTEHGILAPDLIAVECLLYKTKRYIIRIHPLVYLRLLEFLAFDHLGRHDEKLKTLQKLQTDVLDATFGYMRDISFNILGYCHMLCGNPPWALWAYLNSYQIRPSVDNPCVYYTLALIWKSQRYLKMKCRRTSSM